MVTSLTRSPTRSVSTARTTGWRAVSSDCRWEWPEAGISDLDGIAARPEPAVLEDDADTLNEYQVEKLLYFLVRDFIGYELIDGIKHDINVEDVSCDGYNSPVFVYHGDYEQIISNVYHGETELDAGRDSTPEPETPHDPADSPSALDPAFDDGAAPAGSSADIESRDEFDSDESFDEFGDREAVGEFGSSNAFDELSDEDPFGGVDASGHGGTTGFGDDVAYIGSDLPAVGPSDEEDEHEFDTWGDRDIDPSVDRTYSLDDDPTETFDEASPTRRRRDGEGHDEREGRSDDDWNFGVGDSESEEER